MGIIKAIYFLLRTFLTPRLTLATRRRPDRLQHNSKPLVNSRRAVSARSYVTLPSRNSGAMGRIEQRHRCAGQASFAQGCSNPPGSSNRESETFSPRLWGSMANFCLPRPTGETLEAGEILADGYIDGKPLQKSGLKRNARALYFEGRASTGGMAGQIRRKRKSSPNATLFVRTLSLAIVASICRESTYRFRVPFGRPGNKSNP